jgi:hypothetical protein
LEPLPQLSALEGTRQALTANARVFEIAFCVAFGNGHVTCENFAILVVKPEAESSVTGKRNII